MGLQSAAATTSTCQYMLCLVLLPDCLESIASIVVLQKPYSLGKTDGAGVLIMVLLGATSQEMMQIAE